MKLKSPSKSTSKSSSRWPSLRRMLGVLAVVAVIGVALFHSKVQTAEYVLQENDEMKRISSENNPESFVQQWCNLQGAEWYPGGWQERIPSFLLAGAKKSGTTSLSRYLSLHPRIVLPRTKELRFFLPNNFDMLDERTGKTLVQDTRQYMYEHDYKTTRLQNDDSLLGFEATPGYLFQSTTSPKYILCTCPWVKILLILRNPVDRVWSNYNFYLSHNITLPPFGQWVQRDMNLLRSSGMLPENKDSIEFAGSKEEYIAWDKYLNKTQEGPVGRSMYVVQLRHWYDAMKAIGRDPRKDIFIVRNEDLKRDPQTTLNRIFSWLDLPQHELPELKEFMVSHYEERDMDPATRTKLEKFYQPYNQRLYHMLGNDWQGVWDKPGGSSKDLNDSLEKVYAGHAGMRKKKAADNKNMMKWASSTGAAVPRPKGKHARVPPGNKKMIVNENSNRAAIPTDYDKPSYNASVAAGFVERWCELDDNTEWYPTGEDAWQLRAPYFLLPGAKKSGTTSLASYLMQHPNVALARTKELQFFLNKNFRAHFVRDSDRKTMVKPARLAYEREFRKHLLQNNTSLISMDATPGYLFFSSVLPQRILCVCPWIKLVVILRNPIDRAFSNHAYVKKMTGMKMSFDRWIEEDFRALRKSGFIPKDGESLSEEQEDEAWTRYLRLAAEGPIGRSLYEIQLRHWFQAMRDIGRSPESQIYIVRSEDLKKDVNAEYRKLLEFLGLPDHPLASSDEKVVSDYETPMSNKTRAMLEGFFAPYNQRLYDMLGGDWNGYWDPNKQ